MISERAGSDSSWTTIYDGLVSSASDDVNLIEATAPLWVLECLLANKITQQSMVKLSFMVVPWNKGDDDPLPELLNRYAFMHFFILSRT